MLRSILCDYSDAYMLVSGTITTLNIVAAAASPNNIKNRLIKKCAPFTDCISEINDTKIDNSISNVNV